MLTGSSRLAVLATVVATACAGGGGSDDDPAPVAALTVAEARAAIVPELADFDRQRYLSRLDIDRPDVAASYDVAVVNGDRYEKLLRISRQGRTPSFEPRWSTPEPWGPEKEPYRSIPYFPVPFVGGPSFDVRSDAAGLAEARRREVVDAAILGVTRVAEEVQRGAATVHYRVTFDAERARRALAPELARKLFTFPPATPATEDVEVWVDGERRLRRLVRATGPSTTQIHELWAFGEPEPVGVPTDLRLR